MPINVGTDQPAFQQLPSNDPVEPQPDNPEMLSEAPSGGFHPGPDVSAQSLPESEDEVIEPLPTFDPRVRRELEGLLFLGKLTHTFTWMNHTFVIRTLVTDALLEIGMIHKPYVGTLGEVKAYQAAVVASTVVSVDGKPIGFSISDDVSDIVDRFNYVKDHWYPPVLDAIYEEYLLLESKVNDVIEATGKA